jgi:hypothetical protein
MFVGGNLKYAYGWVDIDSSNKIPYEVVVGLARDPIMLACLRVSNLKQSLQFFLNELGMQVLPFPYSRTKGSVFEPQEAVDSVFVGYGVDSLGLLLQPQPKNASPLRIGSQLNGFTIVANDDSNIFFDASVEASTNNISTEDNNNNKNINKKNINAESKVIEKLSPDGYKFFIKKYSEFEKTAICG